ncbi:MAG: hypothetical protein ACR2F8_02850 [Caulobacteraceae bacterium]
MISLIPVDPGVPLSHYRRHDGAVLLTCLDCMHRRTLPLEPVIARLKALGVGDEATGVRAVAGFVDRPCLRCGGTRFETRPAFPAGRKGEDCPRPSHAP